MLLSITDFQAQSKNSTIENALLIAESNKIQLENVEQLVVVYNEEVESYAAILVVLEKKRQPMVNQTRSN